MYQSGGIHNMYICMLGRNTEERLISLKQVILVWSDESIKKDYQCGIFCIHKATDKAYMLV